MLDLIEEMGGKILQLLHVGMHEVPLRHADDLGIGAVLVFHPEHPDRAASHPYTGVSGVFQQHHGVERIAVFAQGVWNEAVVGGVDGGGKEAAVEAHYPFLMVPLVFVAATCGNFNDDINDFTHNPPRVRYGRMTSELDLRGVYVPLITPFTAGDEVAYDEVEKLAVAALEAGAAGIVALGTTGEPATLESSEKAKIIEIAGAICKSYNAHLQVGAGTNSTRASLAAIEAATKAGAQSILSVVPYYTRPSVAGIVAHFKALADASAVPVVAYNIPYRTGRELTDASLLELAAHANIAGVKQAVGGIDAATQRLLAEKPESFHVLCGDDPYIYAMTALGGSGAIAASANVLTEGFVALVDAALKGEHARARQLHQILLPLTSVLFEEPSPAVTKAVLYKTGMISTPALRSPMTSASAETTNKATGVYMQVSSELEAVL